MKYVIGAMFSVAIMAAIVFVFLVMNKQKSMHTETATAISQATSSPASSPTSIASTPNGDGANTATISGKLCYPSHFLPAGEIGARNTITGYIFNQEYLGSENGGTNEFSISVPPGTYILRYKAGNTNGYSTDVCTTGLETTCAADNPRHHNQFIVQAGGQVSNVALCDFYYSPQTNPGF